MPTAPTPHPPPRRPRGAGPRRVPLVVLLAVLVGGLLWWGARWTDVGMAGNASRAAGAWDAAAQAPPPALPVVDAARHGASDGSRDAGAPRPTAGDVQALHGAPDLAALDVTPSLPDGPTGRLVVRATWADGTPAAGVNVRVSSYDGKAAPDVATEGPLDTTGTWTCERAPAGATIVWTDRHVAGRALVQANGTTSVELEIPEGLDITGRVLSVPDTPVPDATVQLVVSNWWPAPATRSDAAGRYALRDVSRHTQLAATAQGHAPSMRVDLTKEEPTGALEIDLPLGGPCGDLEVTVTDVEGRPLKGAQVQLAVPYHVVRPTASWREFEHEVRFRRTDAEGRVLERDLPEGSTSVDVEAAGYAESRGSAEIAAGGTSAYTVRLRPGATVRGTVRDARGRPARGVEVTASEPGLPVPSASATSGDDGTYELTGVPEGPTILRATVRRTEHVQVEEIVTVSAGGEQGWDPVLDLGRHLEGRVVTPDGLPAGRHALSFKNVSPEPWDVDLTTDELGRFSLAACPGGPFMAEVYDWTADEGALPITVVSGVRAAGEELVLTVPYDTTPSAYVVARLVPTDDAPEGDVRLALTSAAQHVAWSRAAPSRIDEATGATVFGPVVPGDYQLCFAQALGFGGLRGLLPVTNLRAGETRDLGAVAPPARGRIVVRIAREGEGTEPRLRLATVGDGVGGIFPFASWELDADAWVARVGAGRYRLFVFAPDVPPRLHELSVEPGRDTLVEVEPGSMVRTDIVFELPGKGPDPPHLEAAVRDAGGAMVWEGGTLETVPAWKAGKPMASGAGEPSFPPGESPGGRPRERVLAWFFGPGRYTVSASFEGGPAVEKAFEVPDDPAATVRVDLSLR